MLVPASCCPTFPAFFSTLLASSFLFDVILGRLVPMNKVGQSSRAMWGHIGSERFHIAVSTSSQEIVALPSM